MLGFSEEQWLLLKVLNYLQYLVCILYASYFKLDHEKRIIYLFCSMLVEYYVLSKWSASSLSALKIPRKREQGNSLALYLICYRCPFLQVESAAQTAVPCKRCAAVMSILALCITGKLVPGVSVQRTHQCHPSIRLQHGMGRPHVLWACRHEKSSVFESTWAKWDPRSKAFRMSAVNPVVSHAEDWLGLCLGFACFVKWSLLMLVIPVPKRRFVCFQCQLLIKL